MSSYGVFTWLVHGSVVSTLLLGLCVLGTLVVRQPADRLRLIQWSLAATLGALVMLAVPQLSLVPLGVFAAEENAAPAAEVEAVRKADPGAAPVSLAGSQALVDSEPAPAALEMPAHQPLRSADRSVEASASGFFGDDLATRARRAVCIAYLLGMAVFLGRAVLARLALARLLRSSYEAPPEAHAELARIAGTAGERVRLLASPQLAGPVTWGTRRPVIVIPSAVLIERDQARLRYYLGHEWGHVSRRDFATWQFAALLQVLLYYQPLFWWVRNRLAIYMDQLADADAAEQGESAVDYADFLVELARRQTTPQPQLSLGIGGRASSLYQRIVFLINRSSRPRPLCPRPWSVCIAAVALLLATVASVVRLDAEPAGAVLPEKPATAAAEQPPAPQRSSFVSQGADGSITYTGETTDAVSGKPIPGVKVTVHYKDSLDWHTMRTSDHETDADGRYTFVIPPKEAAIDSLYLEVEAHHPNFASKSRSGYSHAMIRKNAALGEDPFYSHIRLWPGEAVTGTVVSADGQPLADVEVSIYSSSSLIQERFRGSWDKVKTDAQGAFRIVPATPGDGVLWIKPEKHSPQAHRLADRRGDWGQLVVQKGADVTGHVLDVQGKPVVNVKVGARRNGDGEKPDEYLNQNAVAGQVGRETVTGEQGEFTLASLPKGDYVLTIESNSESYDPPPLEQVFLRTKVAIDEETQPVSIEIRAVPHVILHGTYLDSADKPRRGHEVRLFGRIDGDFFYTQSNSPGEDGKFELRAPHGVEQAELDISTNEHSSIRWRMTRDERLHRGRRPKFGTLEDDVDGFEIVRYRAPVLLVKPVDEAGAPQKDCKPVLKYTRPEDGEQLTVYTTGSHVSFEEQQDGRWRSEQLLPDEPFTVTIEKTGYTTTNEELSLSEGGEKTLTFVLKKDLETKPTDQPPAAGNQN